MVDSGTSDNESNEMNKIITNDPSIMNVTDSKLTIDDFTVIKVVGKGSYGKVLLVKKNDDNTVLAMKVLKKKHMIKRNQVEHTKTERSILELIKHPFIIQLRYAFQTQVKLYFVVDYCPGGELFFHIQKVERFNEEAGKFYAAQIVLAIEHLHSNNIIYRDLKPENVLVDKDGYIKVTDFGLSKQNILDNHSTNSFCGTPEYLAPEIINGVGHGKAVDWWSVGAIIYEMLTGIPPFYSKDREKLFKNIKTGNIKFPVYLSKDSVSIISSFFVHDPDKRLGSDGVDKIKKHPFFKNIDWVAIYNKKIKPPFIPRISNDADTKYIDSEFTNLTPVDSYNPQDYLEGDTEYKGFSYDTNKIK